MAPPISGLLCIEGIPVRGLVDTGASVTCLGFAIWWRHRAQWGALEPFTSAVLGAHGKPLNIAGQTRHLDIQWGEARGRASFIIIVGLEAPSCLIGMDIMRPLRVRIDVVEGTATPMQPDPQDYPSECRPDTASAKAYSSSFSTPRDHGARSFSPCTQGDPGFFLSASATGQVADGEEGFHLTSGRSSACTSLWISYRPGLVPRYAFNGSSSHSQLCSALTDSRHSA